MPTPRELLGDDTIALLQEKGYRSDHIREMAKRAWDLQKDELASQNEQRLSDASKMDNDAVRFGAGIAKGAMEGVRGTMKLAEDAANFLDPRRKSAMQGKYSEPVEKMGSWIHRLDDYQKNYKSTIGDQWDVASFSGEAVGGFVDPINIIPLKGGTLIKRAIGFATTGAMSGGLAAYGGDRDVVEGAAVGAITAPVIGEALHQGAKGIAKLWNKEKERRIKGAQTTDDFDAIAQDELMDIPLMKRVDGGEELTSTLKPGQVDANTFTDYVLRNEDEAVKAQVLQDIKEGKEKSVIDDERFDDLKTFYTLQGKIDEAQSKVDDLSFMEEETQKINAQIGTSYENSTLRFNEATKSIQAEIKANPTILPGELKNLINIKHKPSPEEVMITQFVNDGGMVENRLAGWNVIHALERDIANPLRSAEEYMAGLQKAGFTEESASVITQAYVAKDSGIAKNYFNEKISTKGAEYVYKRGEELGASKRNADGGVPLRETNIPGANEPRGDAAQGRSGDAVSNQERIDASLDNGERAVPNDGPDTPSTSEGSRLPTGDEPMGGQQASGGDVDVFSRPGGDAVVQPKNGDGAGAGGAAVTEVMFKPKKDGRAVRGQLVDLPFGLKGVAIASKDGKSGTIYEHGTASQLSTWGDNTSRKTMEESLIDASYKLEKVGEEKLMSKYAEFKAEGKVVNDGIVEAKRKDEPLKNGVSFKAFNRYSTDVVDVIGREDVLDNGVPVYVTKDKDTGVWIVYDKKSGGIISIDKTARIAKEVGTGKINNMGLEKFNRITDDALKKRMEIEAKNNEALHVPKEELDTKKQSDAKEGARDEGNSNAMDGQGGEMASSSKEDTPQNVDLRSREAVELSKAERKKINESVDVILTKKPEEITEADKDVLRKYTGNGGIESGTYGSLSEHYTPYETVRGVYDALERAGVPMQKALEPAVGSGNFVGHKPELDWTTIDIDPKAHAINKILYPNAKHYNTSFESFKGDGYDAIISNVPFIETRGAGAIKNRPDVKALHDFYFVSAVDKVKEGGVVSFVTSRGTMDKSDMKIRKELMEKSDIIGAYRLPEGTFSKNAHTDVGADIIFLQKRAEGVKAEGKQLANNEAFIKSTKTEDGIYLNDYFQKNPEKILGELEVGVNKQFGTKAYVVKGKADYSKMELDYRKEGAQEALHVKQKELPTDSNDFRSYVEKNGLEAHGIDYHGILMRDGRISVADKRVAFSDIDGGAKVYRDITNTPDGAKIELLSAIAKAGESGYGSDGKKLIAQYQKEYKVHPYSDKELNRLFNAIDEKEKLAELGSFFDKNFTPAQIFDKRTRFSGSGKADIKVDSSIEERMRYHENDKGVVDVGGKPTVFAQGEFYNALEHGYSIAEKGKLQNDILYYSGNLYDKAEKVKALMEAYKEDGIAYAKLEKQLAQIEEMKPVRKGIEEINVRGDEPWLLKNGLEVYPLRKVERTINKGEQKIIEYETPYGKVFDNYINGKALVSMQKDETITSYRRRLREAEDEVQNVLSRIKERILGSSRLKDGIEETYNKMFNGYVSPDYKKASYLIKDTLESLAPGLRLRDNQVEWIIRAVYEGKGINAHDVGGGKTLSGIVLAKELKDKGVAKKPLFVVPAKVIKNWEKEIKRAFPDAKIINLFNLAKETRAKKLYELGNNEADYVLISHEGFKELKLPWDVESRYVDELMSENLRTEDLKGRARALQEEKIKKYKALLSQSNNDKRITMDKLGIDAVFADEARAFKNVGVHSKLVGFKLGKPFTLDVDKNTGSITLDSAAAYDFRFKTRYISEKNNGRNVYMFDATPTPNKPMEIFTMLKHLDNKIFDEYGIHSDRDFANRFFEFGATMNKKGGIEKGLAYIKNAYDLRSIMDRYVNRISMQEFKDKGIISLPEGKVVVHYLNGSDETSLVFQDIRSRLLAAKNNKEERNKIMGIFSEGISASTDPRAYQRGGVRDFIDPTPENNKLEAVVSKVLERRSADKQAGQIIFLDNAGHEQQAAREIDGQIYEPTLEKNLHQELKEKLLASGAYKPKEIAILSGKEITDTLTGKEIKSVSGQRSADMKQAIVDAYDKGHIKVIIGTTKSAGEGMNIQKFTTDIYHMDIPWTPAEIIQRDGRGERFGNQYDTVNKHFFFQSGTFDELMYRAVTKKRGWNEALWDADVKDKIEIVDEGSAMPKEEEFMLQMEKDPIKRRELELQIEYGRLEDELKAVNEDGYVLRGRKEAIKRDIQMSEREIVQHQEKLKSDRPNQYLGELLDKIAKSKDAAKKAEMQADYDSKLKNSRAHIEKMIEAKQRRIVEQNANLEKTIKAIEDNGIDVKEASRKLSLFEENHIGSDGKIKAEIAQEVC